VSEREMERADTNVTDTPRRTALSPRDDAEHACSQRSYQRRGRGCGDGRARNWGGRARLACGAGATRDWGGRIAEQVLRVSRKTGIQHGLPERPSGAVLRAGTGGGALSGVRSIETGLHLALGGTPLSTACEVVRTSRATARVRQLSRDGRWQFPSPTCCLVGVVC